jgi:cysteine desulfurase
MKKFMQKIYFDYASTTPVDPEVVTAMTPYFSEKFGNVSSPHGFGQEAQKAFEEARECLAGFIHAGSEEIIFNSGATEANNHAIIGVARAQRSKGKHIIVSSIEHHSVLEPIEYLRNNEGYDVTIIEVDGDGFVDPQDIKKAITDQTILVAVMYASNEIGTIQPIPEIGAITEEHNVLFLVDAVQAIGHIPVDVNALKADLLSLSAHKFYGPKGIGALYIREGTEIASFLLGGGQEHGKRSSTQNVAGAVGLARAIELCDQQMSQEIVFQTRLRDKLLEEVPKAIAGVRVNGSLSRRLPNNAHFAFEGLQSESLLMGLDMVNIAASMGSACTAGALKASHVLRAIGLSDELAYGALRITLGRWTTEEQVDYFLEQLPGLVKSLRV